MHGALAERVDGRPQAAMRCLWLPLLRVLLWPLLRLPSPWLWRLSGVLARVFSGTLLRRRRRIARINIGLCFGTLAPEAQAQLLRKNLQATVMGLIDSLRAWYVPAPALADIADIDGLEHLAAARAQGRGVIVLNSHMTSITLATRLLNDALHRSGADPVWIMKRPHNHPCIEAEIDRRRRAYCGNTLDKRDAPALLAALSAGRAVAMAADQDFNFQQAFLPFFGVEAATLLAVPSLARRSGAAVLPLWIRRTEGEGRYRLCIGPPWPDYAGGDDVADTLRYLQALQHWLHEVPEQYLWVHRRFKTRPPGQAGFY